MISSVSLQEYSPLSKDTYIHIMDYKKHEGNSEKDVDWHFL